VKTRLLSLAALAALAVGTIAIPAAAGAPTTWYVDDDGTAGANSCAGPRSVPTSIQDAVDASGPGDTIMVCKGKYPEQVVIAGSAHRGLSVVGAGSWTARISPGSLEGAEDGDAIIRVASRDVRIQWLKVVARTTGTCEKAEFGILVDGVTGAVIQSNRVVAGVGGDTRIGPCGVVYGIAVTDGSNDTLVAHNLVQNFQGVGILAHTATDTTVSTNSVRWYHDINVCASVACVSAGRNASPASPASPNGIRFFASTGRIVNNAVSSPEDAFYAPYIVESGIATVASDGVLIKGNIVKRANRAIAVDGLDGGQIRGNTVSGTLIIPVTSRSGPASGSATGIEIVASTGTTVAANRASGFGSGIVASPSSTGNTIKNNNALGNYSDCVDQTGTSLPAGVPNPIDNTWTNNLGQNDYPTGLCTDPV